MLQILEDLKHVDRINLTVHSIQNIAFVAKPICLYPPLFGIVLLDHTHYSRTFVQNIILISSYESIYCCSDLFYITQVLRAHSGLN
jgi:hypothetical protein